MTNATNATDKTNPIAMMELDALDRILDAIGSKIHMYDFGGGMTTVPVPDADWNNTNLNKSMFGFYYVASDGKVLKSFVTVVLLSQTLRRGVFEVPVTEVLEALTKFSKGVEGYEAGLLLVSK